MKKKPESVLNNRLTQRLIPFVIVIFVAILAGRYLFLPGYFNMHDDLQMMRQLEMEKCFTDGQIPCRWVPDMGYGFGFPLFNFYPPLPYLVGEIFRVVGFSFVDSVKIIFLISFIISGITMYILAKEFFGKIGGVLSSVFYVWAPYHAVDIYVRGAMNEAWALIWFPLILWSGYKLVCRKQIYLGGVPFGFAQGKLATPEVLRNDSSGGGVWIIILALSWVGLLLSHNLMAMIFAPVFAGWLLIWIIKSKNLVFSIKSLVLSGFLALGLSAFFTLPAILEQKYVQVDTLINGYYEYIAHFVSIGQLLISRFWGYGPSIWETNDGMPFQVGHLHWLLSLIVIFIIIINFIRIRKSPSILLLAACYLLLVAWFAAFMTHSRSTSIWQLLPPLKFVQFPWRFLTLVILGLSFAIGIIPTFLKNSKFRLLVSVLLIVSLLALNWNYFKPEHMGPLTDSEKFSGAAWELQQTAGIYDYLPKTAVEAPKEPQRVLSEFIEGRGEFTNQDAGTNWATFDSEVVSAKAKVRINIFMFPEWRVFVNGEETRVNVDSNEKWGRMYINLSKGKYHVEARLYNTPVRTYANLISLVTWIGLISYSLAGKYFVKRKK